MITLDQFAQKFIELAADSDYSRYQKLRDISERDIRAAADALWLKSSRNGSVEDTFAFLDESTVVSALRCLARRYDDANDLVSSQFREYWDATDKHIKSPGLLARMEAELCSGFLASKKEEGITVVDNAYGIWLFDL